MKTTDFSDMDVQDILDTIDNLCGVGEESLTEPDNSSYEREELERQGYAELQIDEIMQGIAEGLPVSRYAKDCYNWKQMQEIRLGLLDKLDVGVFDNPLFSAEQMKEIRLGLMDGLDVTRYAKLICSTKDMQFARQDLMSEAYRNHPDGYAKKIIDEESGAKIRISADCMEAFVTLGTESGCTTKKLKKILKKYHIIYGISDDSLERAIVAAGSGSETKVAAGTPAMNGRDGRYEYYFNSLLPGEPKVMEDGSVDYTTVVIADRRNAGDILARYYPAGQGTDGETVTGITIRGGMGVQKPRLKGQGIEYDEESRLYKATESGYVMLNEEEYTLNVRNVYIVEGDINRYNGHISYDGAIYVKGSVGDMAEITASGNVVVDGYVENAHIRAGENIILRGGMNGGGGGSLEAGGKVIGKFFEAVTICAKGDVDGNYFMNCNVITDRSVIAKGTKSKIMGGSIKAGYSVESYSVMAYGKVSTLIDVGDTGWLGSRLRQADEQLAKVRNELYQLKRGREKISGMLGVRAEDNTLYSKTCVAIRMKEEEEEKLLADEKYQTRLLRRATKAYIKVYGQIQEGVMLSIGGRIKRTDKIIKGTVILGGENI